MRPQGETRILPVALTAEEIAVKGVGLAEAVDAADQQRREIERAKANWSATHKALKVELEKREEECSALARIVESGQEEQEVGCSWVYALAAGWAFLVRNDTGEKVDERELDGEERQVDLTEVLREPTPEQLGKWMAQLLADGFQAGEEDVLAPAEAGGVG